MAKKSQKVFGKEYPDPTPVEVPFDFKHPDDLSTMIKRMVRTELSDAADRAGYETWDESQDFDMEEYPDGTPEFVSRYEYEEMENDDFFVEEETRRETARKARENEIENLKGQIAKLEDTLRVSSSGESPPP